MERAPTVLRSPTFRKLSLGAGSSADDKEKDLVASSQVDRLRAMAAKMRAEAAELEVRNLLWP